jgi:D-glycero-D-manno-heptose 1,7-bisphosphate phosphatase
MTTARGEAKTRAVFLDRDDTIMRDVNYCSDPALVEILPGAEAALRRLKAAGFKLIVITNQSGIGRGYFTEDDYRAVEQEVARQLGDDVVDATYFCPDVPNTGSKRRKPEPGMVFEAARDHNVDLSRSFFIGDKAIDAECGRNAGVRPVLLQTSEQHGANGVADWTAPDLAAAANIILAHAV